MTQVPAFLISLAAGMLVTRSSQASNLPSEFLRQLFSRPQALAVAGGFLGILIFTSLPRIPLLLIGAACVGMAVTLSRRETKVQAVAGRRSRPRPPGDRNSASKTIWPSIRWNWNWAWA